MIHKMDDDNDDLYVFVSSVSAASCYLHSTDMPLKLHFSFPILTDSPWWGCDMLGWANQGEVLKGWGGRDPLIMRALPYTL
eukprot:767722-Hanusia_phi.AAC.6